jgi:hypothetical protein
VTQVRLHRVVRLAQTSVRRFRTARFTIRAWTDHRRVTEAQFGHAFTGEPETGETFVKLWLAFESARRSIWAPTRLRFESEWKLAVKKDARWRVVDARSGSVVRTDDTAAPGDTIVEHVDFYPHFPDAGWLQRPGLALLGTDVVADRDAFVVSGNSRSSGILPGTDRYQYALDADAERGVLLRVEGFFRGDLMAVEEAVDVGFDEDFPESLFEDPT